MTHLHIPDGILPVWLWISGLVLMMLVLAACIYRLRGMDRRIKVPLLGVLSAAMLVAMTSRSFPWPTISTFGRHRHPARPVAGVRAAFIVNLMLALLGHGGITVMGLNTLLLGPRRCLATPCSSCSRRGSRSSGAPPWRRSWRSSW